MYHNFTELIKHWFETPSNQQDYSVGTLYFLKLSDNQVMYLNIVAKIDLTISEICDRFEGD